VRELFATDTRDRNTAIERSGLDGCKLIDRSHVLPVHTICLVEGKQLTGATEWLIMCSLHNITMKRYPVLVS